jgi:hypothetical protein
MSGQEGTTSWWLVPLPGTITALLLLITFRKRRWRDSIFLRGAATMPPEHIESTSREVRDLREGESGWVSRSSVVVSKKRRVYVSWTATLQEPPKDPNWTCPPN